MGKDDILIAIESFTCQIGRETFTFIKGVTRVRAGHSAVKANPQYFAPAESRLHYEVEQGTAAPGEKRG